MKDADWIVIADAHYAGMRIGLVKNSYEILDYHIPPDTKYPFILHHVYFLRNAILITQQNLETTAQLLAHRCEVRLPP